MYKYEIKLPKGAKTITLADDRKIRIFAATVAKNESPEINICKPLSDNFEPLKSVKVR